MQLSVSAIALLESVDFGQEKFVLHLQIIVFLPEDAFQQDEVVGLGVGVVSGGEGGGEGVGGEEG